MNPVVHFKMPARNILNYWYTSFVKSASYPLRATVWLYPGDPSIGSGQLVSMAKKELKKRSYNIWSPDIS